MSQQRMAVWVNKTLKWHRNEYIRCKKHKNVDREKNANKAKYGDDDIKIIYDGTES